MVMSNMTTREQIMVLLIVGAIVGGVYGVMRYAPQQKNLNVLVAALEKQLDHINNPKFPEVPSEDVETLKEKAENKEQALTNLRAQVESYEQNLAPTESQDVLLKISEAARTAGVKVIESVPYLVVRKDEVTSDAKPKRKMSSRKRRALAKINKKRNIPVLQGAGMVGAIPKEGELIDRLVNELDEARPLQRVTVEGAFTNLQQFIQSLQAMPWLLTVVKLDIDVNIQTPPQGIPQPIMAKMIIAM